MTMSLGELYTCPKLLRFTFPTVLVLVFTSAYSVVDGFFTALNNEPVSAAISMIRILVFQIGFILVFPLIWGLDGIWFSMTSAEAMSVVIVFVLLFAYRKRYGCFETKKQIV